MYHNEYVKNSIKIDIEKHWKTRKTLGYKCQKKR